MKKIQHKSFIILSCIFIILCSSVIVNAGTNTEVNDIARSLLDEYYDPEYCLDTSIYNIENCYSQQSYENKDQLSNIYKTAEDITVNAKNDEEKVKIIHDWMCNNIEYSDDTSGYNGYPYSDLANPFTVYKEKEAVCYGFANLTQMMLQHIDVPCVIVRGNYSSHVWNAVYLNNKWVFTDNTWDENLSKENNISYRYYLMTNDTYDNSYKTEYIENWAGDACYFPTYVTTKYKYHSIILNSKGGKCISKIPFSENMSNFMLPEPIRDGRTFLKWTNDHDIYTYYYKPFGGWYIRGPNSVTPEQEEAGITTSSGVKGITEDIIFTAKYSLVDPIYEIPTNVVAYQGEVLSNVELPSGFSWVDSNQTLNDIGVYTFKANYTPEDIEDYNIVKNIDIQVEVKELSEKIIDESEELLTNINDTISSIDENHSEIINTINDINEEYTAESTFIENNSTTLSSVQNDVKTSLESANTAINNTEDAYNKLKEGKISEAEAKNILNDAYSKIDTLDKNIKELEKIITTVEQTTSKWNDLNTLWNEEDLNTEISNLEDTLAQVKNTLKGLKEYKNIEPNENIDELIIEFTNLETTLTNQINIYKEDLANGTTSADNIKLIREQLNNIIISAKVDITSIDINNMKKKLEEVSKMPIKLTSSMITLSTYKVTYNGKFYKPIVKINNCVQGRDYTVLYSNNKNVGIGKVTIKGINNYTGTIIKTFNIVTPKPAIKKLSIYKKNRCKIYVKSLGGVTKYRVAYRIKGKKKWSYKTLTAKKNIVILTKLKHKKRYQIKIAAVCPYNSKQIKYSSYSSIKNIKTK